MPRQETPVKSKVSFQPASGEFAGAAAQSQYPSRLNLKRSGCDRHRLASAVSDEKSNLSARVTPLKEALSSNHSSNPQAQSWLSQKVQGVQRRLGKIQPMAPAPQGNGPLIGIIDTGFGPGQHGQQVLQKIQSAHTDSQILLADGVGKGTWADSLTQFVDVAKVSGQTRAVANLSFDLTQKNPDGSVTTRQQLTTSESKALDYARQNNVLVVASAGNEGGALSALGRASGQSDNLIVVGAAENNDRAAYSSFGRGLDFLVSADGQNGGGTSMAAAETTGAIANLWATNPHLTPRQVVQTLEATVQDLKTPGWDMKTGLGVLNPKTASLAAKTLPTQTLLAGLGFLKTSDSLSSEVWSGMDSVIATERPNLNPRQADARSKSARKILRKAHNKVRASRSRPANPRQADARSASARRILRKAHNKVSSTRSGPSAAYTRNEHQAHRNIAKRAAQSRRSKLLTYKPGNTMRSGNDVRQWQQKMKKLGYKIKVDGIYGPASQKVARQFQRKHKLAADGIVGSKTRAATAKAIKAKTHRRRATQASARINPRAADGRSPTARKILRDARLKTYQRRSRNEHQFHKREAPQSQTLLERAQDWQQRNSRRIDKAAIRDGDLKGFFIDARTGQIKENGNTRYSPLGLGRLEMGPGIKTNTDLLRNLRKSGRIPKSSIGTLESNLGTAKAEATIGDDGFTLGGTTSGEAYAVTLGTSNSKNNTDKTSRVGVVSGHGLEARGHWDDVDNDGFKEFGIGGDAAFLSGDLKTEDPLRTALSTQLPSIERILPGRNLTEFGANLFGRSIQNKDPENA
ncbi:MAG: S8 family serine peptidase [Phormidesmis sp.]